MLRSGGISAGGRWTGRSAPVIVAGRGRAAHHVTHRRSRRLGRALLVLALVVVAVSGVGFTVLLAHISTASAMSLLSGGGLGTLFKPSPACATPIAGAACVAAQGPQPLAGSAPYSHSWYVVNPDQMPELATLDARWLNSQSVGNTCGLDFLTVLDFAHPIRAAVGHASPLDDYAMTLFRHPGPATYRQVEGIAEHYLDAWVAAASDCPKLHLGLGTSNFNECGGSVGACDVYTAGQYWDVVAHDVMDYVAAKGYGAKVTGIWVADDLETSWDPWPTTKRFLQGVRDQEHTYTAHAQLVNYGDANVGACSIVTGSCRAPWGAADVYAAAWGLGWAIPLPELYNSTTTKLWDNVARTQSPQNPMIFAGAMTECGGADPLPVGACRPQGGGVTGRGDCEWSPTIAINHVQANAATRNAPTLYATNMQWPPGSSGAKTNNAPCA